MYLQAFVSEYCLQLAVLGAELTASASTITPAVKAKMMTITLRIKIGRLRLCGVEKQNSAIKRGRRSVRKVCPIMTEFSEGCMIALASDIDAVEEDAVPEFVALADMAEV